MLHVPHDELESTRGVSRRVCSTVVVFRLSDHRAGVTAEYQQPKSQFSSLNKFVFGVFALSAGDKAS